MNDTPPPALVVHAGLVAGELILNSNAAVNPGVVVIPAGQHPHRFLVEPVSGGQFLLQRVALLPWPAAPHRVSLYAFDEEGKAQAALRDLQQALLALDENPASSLPEYPQQKGKFAGIFSLMIAALLIGMAIGRFAIN